MTESTPDAPVHLEGMGVVGSVLAWHFDEAGLDFTWHDTELELNAWRASTGTVYPSGHSEHQPGYEWWRGQHQWPWVTRGSFWFTHKHPPHEGAYDITHDLGALRRGDPPSIHVNVQAFVRRTRKQFAARRRPEADAPESHPGHNADHWYIVTHGFGERNDGYLWGWHARVTLAPDPALTDASPHRPYLYCKRGRYVLAYAAPIPGDSQDRYYAGSSLIHQDRGKERPLTIDDKFDTWNTHFHDLTDGLARITAASAYRQGWRPKPRDPDAPLVTRAGRRLLVRPLKADGLKLAPAAAQRILMLVDPAEDTHPNAPNAPNTNTDP